MAKFELISGLCSEKLKRRMTQIIFSVQSNIKKER